MNLPNKMAALLAAVLLTGTLSGCDSGPLASSADVPEVTTERIVPHVTTRSAAESEEYETIEVVDPEKEICGKWQVTEADSTDMFEGDFASEPFCSLFQMELLDDHTVNYYNRIIDFCCVGTWSMESDDEVNLQFLEREVSALVPFTLMGDEMCTEYSLIYSDDELYMETPYSGPLIFERTDSFAERICPEIAWLSGLWLVDQEKSDPLPDSLRDPRALMCEALTVDRTATLLVTQDGGKSCKRYSVQLQPDGSFEITAVELSEEGDPFDKSVIRQDGDEVKWEINHNGFGTVYMKKVLTMEEGWAEMWKGVNYGEQQN